MGIISTDLKGAIAISLQSFPNSGKGWGGESPPVVGIGNFTGWGGTWRREPEEEWFSRFKPFSKLKTSFWVYWVITWKLWFSWGGKLTFGGGRKSTGGIFLIGGEGGGNEQIFGWWGTPPIPLVGKTLACDLRVICKIPSLMKNYFNFKDKIKRD